MPKQVTLPTSILANRTVGSAFATVSGLSFLLLCMLLPLVGPAGAVATEPKKNLLTFLAVLLLAFLSSIAAMISKFERRKIDQSPLPLLSIVLCGLCLLLLVALIFGWLHI